MIDQTTREHFQSQSAQARSEATAHWAGEQARQRIEQALAGVRAVIPSGDPADHEVPFNAASWSQFSADVADKNAERILAHGHVSRRDVSAVADRVLAGHTPARTLLLMSNLWGYGDRGYGPGRHKAIVNAAGDRLDPVLGEALTRLQEIGAIGAYAWLIGSGNRNRPRYAPLDPRAGRLHGFGPAFFTKLLYFADRPAGSGALILDQRLATNVTDLVKLEHLLTTERKMQACSSYRYAVYLAWMHQTAAEFEVAADLLELALFRIR